jgi:hypothetical protein
MENSKSPCALPSEFDAFLYEPIGEEGETMPVTVLSALARLNLDLWEEAATLACMPRPAAARQLESRIEMLPAVRAAGANCAEIAAHLLALLPGQIPRTVPGGAAPSPLVVKRRFALSPYVIYVLFMLLALGAQWFISSPPARTPVVASPAPAAHVESNEPVAAHP